MSPLPPPPPSAKPPMPQQRRKTSLRTVPKEVQGQFKKRLETLREDPLQVLPECIGPEPKVLAKIRAGLTKLSGGKAGFLLKRDKGIVGAVVASTAMVDKPIPTRMLDTRVGGQRRFFTVRGQIERMALLGVQNYDHPPALLMGYRSLAKAHSLHFFAQPKLWCTGTVPNPPQEWIEALAKRVDITLEARDGGWRCPHEGGVVVLKFRDGPTLEFCGACGKAAGNMHRLVASRYAGPRQRQPFGVAVRAPDGQEVEPEREAKAEYRAGIRSDAELIRSALADWKPEGKAWMLGETIHRSLEDWIQALHPEPWEATALEAMASKGYSGNGTSVAAVLESLKSDFQVGIRAILGDGTRAFASEHERQSLRDQLRAAMQEANRRDATKDLPRLRLGPVGTLIDTLVRTNLADGRPEALKALRQAIDAHEVPGLHLAAVLRAMGGDVTTASKLTEGDREAGASLSNLVEPILEAKGDAYREALAAYLLESGSGEDVARA